MYACMFCSRNKLIRILTYSGAEEEETRGAEGQEEDVRGGEGGEEERWEGGQGLRPGQHEVLRPRQRPLEDSPTLEM